MVNEGGSRLRQGVGITMEELSGTKQWQALSPRMKRILADALGNRDLTSAVVNATAGISDDVQALIVKNLAADPNVIAATMRYALGVAPESEVKSAEPKAAEPVVIATGDPAVPEIAKTALAN